MCIQGLLLHTVIQLKTMWRKLFLKVENEAKNLNYGISGEKVVLQCEINVDKINS